MLASEELLQGDEVAQALTHLLPVDGDHVVVHPVVHHLITLAGNGLCDLAFVVGEDKIHATTVDVEVVAEILARHGRALAVPSREAIGDELAVVGLAVGLSAVLIFDVDGPAHDVFGLCLLPEGEVGLMALLAHTGQLARVVDDVLKIAVGEDAVVMVLVVFLHVEVDGAVALVGIAVVENLAHHLGLFDDVACGVGLYRRRQYVEHLHGLVVAVGVVLRHLHWLELFQTGLLLDLVVALVGVVLQVAHVGDVAHVAYLVAKVSEIAEKHVEGDGRARMAQMRIAVDGGTADIHAHMRSVERLEEFLLPRQGIVNQKILFHIPMIVCIVMQR